MQVTITRSIDLPDELSSINQLETEILAFGRSVMQELLAEAWQHYQRSQWRCEVCDSQNITGEGYKDFGLFTLFGHASLKRHRVICHSCGHHSQPCDSLLKVQISGHATKAFVELSCLCAASWPYAQAADVLERITADSISHEQVRRLATQQGCKLSQDHLEEAQEVLEEHIAAPALCEQGPDMLNIVLDGGWVRSRDNKEGMEAKVGVVFLESEQVGKDRWKLKGRRYSATFQSSEVLGKLCYKQAFDQGVESAQKKAVIGDGAEWISSIAQEHFPQAVRILDLWHLERRLAKAVNSALGDDEQRELLRASLSDQLRSGKVQQVLSTLDALVEMYPESKLGEFAGYVNNNSEWIGCYDELKADGYVVGSGAVEKGVDIVVNRRFKGRRGMRWKRVNADGIVALRLLELNDDWDEYWRDRKTA